MVTDLDFEYNNSKWKINSTVGYMTLIFLLQRTGPDNWHNVKALTRTTVPQTSHFLQLKQCRATMCSSAHLLITAHCFPADGNSNLNGPKAAEFVGRPLRKPALKALRGRCSADPSDHRESLNTTYSLTVRLLANVLQFVHIWAIVCSAACPTIAPPCLGKDKNLTRKAEQERY